MKTGNDGSDMLALLDERIAEWKTLCAIIDADPGDPMEVFARARTVMAAFEVQRDESMFGDAARTFPLFAKLHHALDAALMYEYARFERHIDDAVRDRKRQAREDELAAAKLAAQEAAKPTFMAKPLDWARKMRRRKW
jgi:hypothetical protein